MKKAVFQILRILIAFWAFPTMAQTVIAEDVYDSLKAEGALKDSINYRILQNHPTTRQSADFIPPGPGYILAIPPSDDGSSAEINLGFDFCFFGNTEKKIFINNNGNVSFGQHLATGTPIPFPLQGYKIIAPFWSDVDTRARGGVWYKKIPHAFIVNWQDVGHYNQNDQRGNSFQMIISDGQSDMLPFGYTVGFFFDDMQWTAGDASGTNGFGGAPAEIGLNSGIQDYYIIAGFFNSDSNIYHGPFGPPGGVEWVKGKYMYFNTCDTANIEPAIIGHRLRDTIGLCVGDVYRQTYYFPAPESGQQAAVGVNAPNFPGFSLLSVSTGQMATAEIEIVASAANMGAHTMEFTLIDNGIPGVFKKFEVVVLIDSLPQPLEIIGDTFVCEGAQTTLSVAPVYQSYIWSNGLTTPQVTVGAGTYRVTVSHGGCERSDTHTVATYIPYPEPDGLPFICPPDTHVITTLPGYDDYQWSTGDTGSTLQVTAPGIYVITVTDLGCTAIDSFEVFPLNDSTFDMLMSNLNICNGAPVELDAGYDFDAFLWSTGDTSRAITVFQSGNYVVTVTLFSSDPNIVCSAKDTATIGTINMTPIVLLGDTFICGEGGTQLTVADTFDSYLWSTGQTSQSSNFYSSGNYGVTVTDSTCADSLHFYVSLIPAPEPQIFGAGYYCPGGDSVDLWVLPLWDSLIWSTGDTSLMITVAQGWKWVVVWKDGCKTKTWHKVRLPEDGFKISGSDHICPGESAVLVAPFGYDSYQWSNGDMFPTTLVSTPGDYYVVVSLDTCVVTSDTHTVVSVIPDFPKIYGDTVMCDGNPGFIYVQMKYNSYIWSTGQAVPGIYYSSAGWYSVTVEDTNQCVSSDSIFVTVEPSPVPVIVGDTHICLPETGQIGVDSIYHAYNWSNGENDRFIEAGTGTYYVTVTDFTNCKGVAGPWTVNGSSPQATIDGDSINCPDKTGVLFFAGTEDYRLMWSTGDTTDTIRVLPGIYMLSVTDDYKCVASDTFSLDSLPAPFAGINISPEGELYPGDLVTFYDNTDPNGLTIITWIWDIDDTVIYAENTDYLFTKAGEYNVIHSVRADNGCTDTAFLNIEIIGKVRNVNVVTANGDGVNDFLAFPSLEQYPGSNLRVFNRWGGEVYASDNYSNDWDGGDLPEGTYFYILVLPDGTVFKGEFMLLK